MASRATADSTPNLPFCAWIAAVTGADQAEMSVSTCRANVEREVRNPLRRLRARPRAPPRHVGLACQPFPHALSGYQRRVRRPSKSQEGRFPCGGVAPGSAADAGGARGTRTSAGIPSGEAGGHGSGRISEEYQWTHARASQGQHMGGVERGYRAERWDLGSFSCNVVSRPLLTCAG